MPQEDYLKRTLNMVSLMPTLLHFEIFTLLHQQDKEQSGWPNICCPPAKFGLKNKWKLKGSSSLLKNLTPSHKFQKLRQITTIVVDLGNFDLKKKKSIPKTTRGQCFTLQTYNYFLHKRAFNVSIELEDFCTCKMLVIPGITAGFKRIFLGTYLPIIDCLGWISVYKFYTNFVWKFQQMLENYIFHFPLHFWEDLFHFL